VGEVGEVGGFPPAAIERFTGYDLSTSELLDGSVEGDVYTGNVILHFQRTGKTRRGVCIFDSGNTKSVTLDGKLLAGSL
jgi:hypothetical protein